MYFHATDSPLLMLTVVRPEWLAKTDHLDGTGSSYWSDPGADSDSFQDTLKNVCKTCLINSYDFFLFTHFCTVQDVFTEAISSLSPVSFIFD